MKNLLDKILISYQILVSGSNMHQNLSLNETLIPKSLINGSEYHSQTLEQNPHYSSVMQFDCRMVLES